MISQASKPFIRSGSYPIIITTKSKSIISERLTIIIQLLISVSTLVLTIILFFISKDLEFSKIKYDQQLLTYAKLLNIARDLKGETKKDIDTDYYTNLSKFDMISSGELKLIAEPNVLNAVTYFRADITNHKPADVKELDDDYNALVETLKNSIENTKK